MCSEAVLYRIQMHHMQVRSRALFQLRRSYSGAHFAMRFVYHNASFQDLSYPFCLSAG